jgi:hypothetical protein
VGEGYNKVSKSKLRTVVWMYFVQVLHSYSIKQVISELNNKRAKQL